MQKLLQKRQELIKSQVNKYKYFVTPVSIYNRSAKYFYIKISSMIISPCLSICKTDPITGYCYGCGRTNEEKKIWKDPDTKDLWKQNNLTQLFDRLTGWQLQSFKESYDHKVKNGKPLINKIIEKK